MAEYPKFYYHRGRAIKRESATSAIEVRVPEQGSRLPLMHVNVAELGIITEQQLDEYVAGMKPCEQDRYESYLGTFYHISHSNRVVYNNYRQKQYDNGTLKL
ncbi:MAG: hypothetical protein O9302_00220 [Cyclobacteriaceae bacterium]|jgi:hypothetical protein|nr:hypothetical protein [Cytophagales bacterium]MCZ8326455.1 hypothetical protein [Cyclobacteriaceae bacterium]